MSSSEFHPSNSIAEAVKDLPAPVVAGIENFAATYGCTVAQVMELAIASFLHLDTTSFGELEDYPLPGDVIEELAIVKMQLTMTRQALQEAGLPDPSIPPKLPKA